jgi:predicted secreted Zn-dependent protease
MTLSIWEKDKTDLILGHEQGHFDIAEIYIRKLYQAVKQYTFNKKTYKTELRDIYQRIAKEKDSFQNEYDAATHHSINVEQQKIWEAKIKATLKELDDYANYKSLILGKTQ